MKQKNFLKIAMLFVFAIISNFSFGQTTIYTQSFETDLDGYSHTPSQTPATDAGDQYFYRAEPSDNSIYEGGVGPYTNITGSWLFVGSNPKTINSSNPGILSTGMINVTGYSDLELSIDFGAVPADWDVADELKVEYSWNNSDWFTLYDFESPATNSPLVLANNTAGGSNTANGVTLNYALQTIISNNFTGSGNSLFLRIQCNAGSNYEAFGLDNIILKGTASSSPTIGFDTSLSSQTETNATFNVTIPVTVSNYDGNQIDVSIAASGTAESGDYSLNTTSLSFTTDESQNISLDINDDADIDEETIILTITETSAVTGLIISQHTHTITISDDEAPIPLVEDFTNSMATASYLSSSFLGNNNITWTYESSRNENGDGNGVGIDGNALMLRDLVNNSKVTSSTISGGISNFSVKLYKGFTGSGNRQVELFINNISKGVSVIFDDADDKDDYTFTVNDINIKGEIIIEIRNISSKQVIVDNISWTTYSPTVTWEGNDSTDWATATNWDTDVVPDSDDNVVIPDVITAPIIGATTAATANNLTITEIDGLNILSGGSLIVEGSSTGNVTYNRTVNFVSGDLKGWFLMASPVVGQDYDDAYITANDIASKNTNRGIATYTTSSDSWLYHQGAASATFTVGKGYSVKRQTNTGDVSFTGTLNTDDAGVDALLSTDGNRFNLLGNPYTSFLSSATFLNNESAISDTKTMWVYNETLGTDGQYEVKTVNQDFKIAPGQGFFVQANTTGGTFNFSEANQIHNADTFQKTEGKTEITLSITDGTINNYSKVYYLENASRSFDIGYEGELFNGQSNSFAVYTHLISDSQGKKYQVQSLPKEDYENMVIPIGVNATAGKEITFTVEALNLPTNINVYLEDRLENTYTRLDKANSNLKITFNDAVNGTGRFYLHTTSSVLSIDNNAILNSLSIFKSDATTLKIVGLPQGKVSISLFNILGKQMMTTSFEANGANGAKDISLQKLATGIYFAKVQTETGKVSKKIILE